MKKITIKKEGSYDGEFDYKCLVYPNITYSKDLEKDSYIVVLKNIIEYFTTTDIKIHWTVLLPHSTNCLLKYENMGILQFVEYKLPTYPNTMRTHFDSEKFMKILDWKHNDFDFIYCHLPEHASQISNILHNNTDLNIPIYGYCHWYEIDENTSYNKRMFLSNIAGTLEMEECGVNSQWLKNLIIKKASEYFNDDILKKLDKIIQPHYLGIDSIHPNLIENKKNDIIPKSIIFNHRPNEYTGFDWFIQILDELYKERQDFKLYLTLTDLDRPYAERKKFNKRSDYIDFLSNMYIGVCAFEKYSAWSIATTDSLSQGVPYLMPDKLCYPEMMNNEYPLFYTSKEDFKEKLNKLLDDDAQRELAVSWLRKNIKSFMWNDRISKWFNNWKFLKEFPTLKEKTQSYYKILEIIKTLKKVSKSDILDKMGWGVRIGFSNYRNTLRNEKNVKLYKNTYVYEK